MGEYILVSLSATFGTVTAGEESTMNDRARAWGSPDREHAYDPDSNELHFDHDSPPIPDVDYQSPARSDALRRSLGDDLQVVVERTAKQWNGVVRECLRKQTGLRLSTDAESNPVVGRLRKVRSVPVRVDSGLPIRFVSAVRNMSDQDIMLLLHRSKLDDVIRGTEFMIGKYHDLSKIKGPSAAKSDEIKKVKGFAEGLLERIMGHDKLKSILEVDEDLLGAYFFRIPEIRLYWIVIGAYSQILDIPPDALTVVVLIHELAHAYTHLGYDIDNRDWNTEAFAESDVYLVEGLAQFYTEVICDQIKQRLPAAKDAFGKLLDGQGDVYREHKNWMIGDDSGRMGEAIRISMLECRSNEICDVDRFRGVLEKYRDKFH